MSVGEKFWLTVLLTFCRYLSIVMMLSGIVFIFVGYYLDNWFYMGLISWPLFIMLGIVNFKYLDIVTKTHNLQFSKILEKKDQ